VFQWAHEHDAERKELLSALASKPLLKFFWPGKKKKKISTDASKDDLGAVLLQKDEGA